MRYGIIADIHANLTALEAAFDDMAEHDVEELWCLGDIVGYGPDPLECIDIIRESGCRCIAGNHDRAVCGKANLVNFNHDAVEALKWTADELGDAEYEYLNGLPDVLVFDDVTLVHGSPRIPLFEYMTSISIARENFAILDTTYCFFGHSHIPQIYQSDLANGCTATGFPENLKGIAGDNPLMINPGSVGQPRDGDPTASYAVYDSGTRIVRLYRTAYNIRKTQDSMIKKGLPIRLAGRLESGR